MDEFRRRPVNRISGTQPTNQPLAPTPVPRPQPVVSPAPMPTPQTGIHQATPPQPTPPNNSGPVQSPPLQPAPVNGGVPPEPRPLKKNAKKKRIIWGVGGVLAVLIVFTLSIFVWYAVQLSPVKAGDTTMKVVKVTSGSTPADIADILEKAGVIRSSTAFLWYTRFQKVQNNLQAGTYRLSPSESTKEIVDYLVKGKVDIIKVTLYPGATLVDKTSTPEDQKYDVTTALKRVGYTDAQIAAGLAADYPEYASTLFQGRPAGADLEGYVYGETYQVAGDATVQDVLRTSFAELWKYIQENDLVAKYKAQGLSLYEGITLASIVQREASANGDDMPQIAQVFYSRLASGMPLGSDITYQYIADKTGVPRDPNLDSPYNTRRYAGLPPGPVSAPGAKALSAVGNPAPGTYLYFLSGDDGVTYFAHTLQEHQQNITNHCKEKCQIL